MYDYENHAVVDQLWPDYYRDDDEDDEDLEEEEEYLTREEMLAFYKSIGWKIYDREGNLL